MFFDKFAEKVEGFLCGVSSVAFVSGDGEVVGSAVVLVVEGGFRSFDGEDGDFATIGEVGRLHVERDGICFLPDEKAEHTEACVVEGIFEIGDFPQVVPYDGCSAFAEDSIGGLAEGMEVDIFFVPCAEVHGDGEAFDALADFLEACFAGDGVGGVGQEEVCGGGGEGCEEVGVVLADDSAGWVCWGGVLRRGHGTW